MLIYCKFYPTEQCSKEFQPKSERLIKNAFGNIVCGIADILSQSQHCCKWIIHCWFSKVNGLSHVWRNAIVLFSHPVYQGWLYVFEPVRTPPPAPAPAPPPATEFCSRNNFWTTQPQCHNTGAPLSYARVMAADILVSNRLQAINNHHADSFATDGYNNSHQPYDVTYI